MLSGTQPLNQRWLVTPLLYDSVVQARVFLRPAFIVEVVLFEEMRNPGHFTLLVDTANPVQRIDSSFAFLRSFTTCDQLPRLICDIPDRLPYADLFSRITNETPANIEIIKSVIADLRTEGVLEIRDKTGMIQFNCGLI